METVQKLASQFYGFIENNCPGGIRGAIGLIVLLLLLFLLYKLTKRAKNKKSEKPEEKNKKPEENSPCIDYKKLHENRKERIRKYGHY